MSDADTIKSRAAWFSIAANGLLIVFKLVVGTISGSIGIISEALHSGTDLIAAIIALVSVREAAGPPTSSTGTATRRSRTSRVSSRGCSSGARPC